MVNIFVKISTPGNIFTVVRHEIIKYFGELPIYPSGTSPDWIERSNFIQ